MPPGQGVSPACMGRRSALPAGFSRTWRACSSAPGILHRWSYLLEMGSLPNAPWHNPAAPDNLDLTTTSHADPCSKDAAWRSSSFVHAQGEGVGLANLSPLLINSWSCFLPLHKFGAPLDDRHFPLLYKISRLRQYSIYIVHPKPNMLVFL